MSTAKRVRQSQGGAHTSASQKAAISNKRSKTSHEHAKSGLEFLVDQDARAGRNLDARLTNGAPRPNSYRVDDSVANVAQDTPASDGEDGGTQPTQEIIDISSGVSSSELEEDEVVAGNGEAKHVALLTNGHVSHDAGDDRAWAGAEDADMEDANDAPPEEVTFGDLLQARHPDPIDISKALHGTSVEANVLVPTANGAIIPSGHSLGTVLSQALKNNDKDLLESCFATQDHQTIRLTIQRIKSHEVAVLLEKIAERIHRKPGRTGNLMVWVQWSLVTHGGYLSSQPVLMKKLRSLSQVVRERANGLQPLLHLKGKLDLLSAQLELRRSMQDASRAMNSDELDDPEGVLYIEGQDDSTSSEDEIGGTSSKQSRRRNARELEGIEEAGSEDDMDDALPNGLSHDIEEESSEEDGDDLDDMLDVEAEEGDSADDDEAGSDEADSDIDQEEDELDSSEEDDSEIDVKTLKAQTLHRKR